MPDRRGAQVPRPVGQACKRMIAREVRTMRSVHQLKITLKATKPPIWRRLEVPSAATLQELHQVILTAFDWHGGHLHEFDAGGARFGEPHPDDYVRVQDERRVTLGRLAPAAGDTFDYLYDFGDSW